MAKAKRFFCVVAYDVQNDKQRGRIAKLLEHYGVRINFSVFECMFTAGMLAKVQARIAGMIDTREDTVVYYTICVDCFTRIVYQPDARNRKAKSIQIV